MLFGVSIALKDGVEKASEYFAGCVLLYARKIGGLGDLALVVVRVGWMG